MKLTENIEVFNEDCNELMKRYKDGYFDLAICDVNYGIGEDGLKNHSRGKLAKPKLYTPKNWDKESVSKEILYKILQKSKNQIIWGANHFISKIPFDSSCWIVWDKLNGDNDFADCELAWTSFNSAVRIFKFRWAGMLQQDMKNKQIRIHPTEKPVKLYEWLLLNYAKPNDKILDTHFGSLSIGIAIDNVNRREKMNLSLVASELDKDYYNAAIKRFKQVTSQRNIYDEF